MAPYDLGKFTKTVSDLRAQLLTIGCSISETRYDCEMEYYWCEMENTIDILECQLKHFTAACEKMDEDFLSSLDIEEVKKKYPASWDKS